VLQQAAGVWCTPVPAGPASEEVTRRCRHAVAAVGPYVFIFGGLRGSTLLDDFLLADDSSGTELSICDPRSPAWCEPALLPVHTALWCLRTCCCTQAVSAT
jgi:protein phosphatase